MGEIIKNQDSRRIFIDTLIELAEKDESIVLVTCDVGFNYLETFSKKFPNRFFNFGVTEASSVLIASALALAGQKVYFYSMINFTLFRPGEMVRNGVVMHGANVKLIGVKGSESYKFLGFSHNLLHENEDRDFCKNIKLDCYIPTSNDQIRDIIMETYNNKKPAYIRL